MRPPLRGALFSLLALAACSEDFEPPSHVHGLRVLAVQTDPGSGVPGARMALRMLVAQQTLAAAGTVGTDGAAGAADGSAGDNGTASDAPSGNSNGPTSDCASSPHRFSVAWVAGCNNPPGRQYFSCLPAMREAAARVMSGQSSPVALAASLGCDEPATHFAFTLPEDIVSSAPLVEHDPIHYGVSYVFFAACAGNLTFDAAAGGDIPAVCTGFDGKPVDASGFVTGFTTIYSYENQINGNPILDAVTFDGEDMPATSPASAPAPCTSDADCAGDYRHPRICTADTRTCAPVITTCTDACKEFRIAPRVNPASFEQFSGGNEIMWASYYTNAGPVKDDTRLIVDRVNGPTSDYSTVWATPKHSGTARLWLTVNDQRGGANWGYFDVAVQ